MLDLKGLQIGSLLIVLLSLPLVVFLLSSSAAPSCPFLLLPLFLLLSSSSSCIFSLPFFFRYLAVRPYDPEDDFIQERHLGCGAFADVYQVRLLLLQSVSQLQSVLAYRFIN